MFPLPDCTVLRGRGRVLDGCTFREIVHDADYSLYIHPPIHEALSYTYSGYFSAPQSLEGAFPKESLLLELAAEHHCWQFALQRPMAVVETRTLAFGQALPLEEWPECDCEDELFADWLEDGTHPKDESVD